MTKAVWIILAVALLVRLGNVAVHHDYTPVGDPADYERIALKVSDFEYPGRTRDLPGPTAYRPPAYPMFLGALYAISTHRTWARVGQALIGTVTVGLIGLVALMLFRRRDVALVAMGIAAVWPSLWVLNGAFLSEVLFVPLTLGAVAAALRWREQPELRWALLAGVLIGLATLTRANGIALVLPLAVALWRPGTRRAVPIVAMLAAAALTIAPWTIRNAIEFDAFVPVTTEDGYTLAGTYNDVARNQDLFPAAWVNWYDVPSNVRAVRRVENDERVWNDELRGEALDFAFDHPRYVAHVAWWNLRRLFDAAGGDWMSFEFHAYGLTGKHARAERLTFWPVFVIALAGLAVGAWRRFPRWFVLVPVVFLLPVFITGYMRLRAPIDPYIAMLAAFALVTGYSALRSETERRR